jgi:uncharacterized protein
MSQQNVEAAKAAYQTFASGDMGALRALFADDAEWEASDELPVGGVTQGADTILARFQEIPSYWEEMRFEPGEFIDGGDYVVVRGTQRGRGQGRCRGGPFLQLMKFNADGKLVHGEFATDSAKVLKSLG